MKKVQLLQCKFKTRKEIGMVISVLKDFKTNRRQNIKKFVNI